MLKRIKEIIEIINETPWESQMYILAQQKFVFIKMKKERSNTQKINKKNGSIIC